MRIHSVLIATAVLALPVYASTGTLESDRGPCPLRHTAVKADISGPLSRVTVTQEYTNPYPDKIEAVYTFPLPHDAAVDDMTVLVGDRRIRGLIKRREEARAIYDSARKSGRLAGLLDQERPNIFTQSVANIPPGAKVKIEISYVEMLPYQEGTYEFLFPMVIGPRYIPHGVADAARITPPVTPPGTRAGHDISIAVSLDAGAAIDKLESITHEIAVTRAGAARAAITLKDKAVIPNKDFILRYGVSAAGVEDAVLTHWGARGGYFTLALAPPERVAAADITPKELVFVLDSSGSMMGFPIEKAKETMRLALDGLNPRDTFNLITFSGDTRILFPAPVPATAANLARAQEFLASRAGSGGTEMMKAVRAAVEGPDTGRVRVVCFMTDGMVGNDMEIIAEVQRHPQARVFAFGIGSSTNRFLLDNMARYGRGEVEYVGLNQDGSAAARRFHERVRSPLLTDISIDWGSLPVADVLPARTPDLFAARPLVISGRYTAAAAGTIRLRGRMGGHAFNREISVRLPAAEPAHDVLAALWARRRVADLLAQDFRGARTDIKEQVTQLGLNYRLATPFTSFVAVEETTVMENGEPRRIEVPVEMPEGVSYEGIFGEPRTVMAAAAMPMQGGVVGGVIGGIIGGGTMAPRRRAFDAAPPPPSSVKMAPSLVALAASARPDAPKVTVQIYLTDTSAGTLAQLRKFGFEVLAVPKMGTIVTGRIAPAKLTALAALTVVRYVAPRA